MAALDIKRAEAKRAKIDTAADMMIIKPLYNNL
jgi:hypothetical protein